MAPPNPVNAPRQLAPGGPVDAGTSAWDLLAWEDPPPVPSRSAYAYMFNIGTWPVRSRWAEARRPGGLPARISLLRHAQGPGTNRTWSPWPPGSVRVDPGGPHRLSWRPSWVGHHHVIVGAALTGPEPWTVYPANADHREVTLLTAHADLAERLSGDQIRNRRVRVTDERGHALGRSVVVMAAMWPSLRRSSRRRWRAVPRHSHYRVC